MTDWRVFAPASLRRGREVINFDGKNFRVYGKRGDGTLIALRITPGGQFSSERCTPTGVVEIGPSAGDPQPPTPETLARCHPLTLREVSELADVLVPKDPHSHLWYNVGALIANLLRFGIFVIDEPVRQQMYRIKDDPGLLASSLQQADTERYRMLLAVMADPGYMWDDLNAVTCLALAVICLMNQQQYAMVAA